MFSLPPWLLLTTAIAALLATLTALYIAHFFDIPEKRRLKKLLRETPSPAVEAITEANNTDKNISEEMPGIKQIESHHTPPNDTLKEQEDAILMYIRKNTPARFNLISKNTGIPHDVLNVHLDNLIDRYIVENTSSQEYPRYKLTLDGTEYLMKRGLI